MTRQVFQKHEMRSGLAVLIRCVAIMPTIFLSACVGPFIEEIEIDTNTSTRLRETIPSVTIADLRQRPYRVIAQVEGNSCFNNFITDKAASPEAALDTLRLKASQLGADALLEPYCSSQGTSLATNCWQSYHCKAAAIGFNSGSTNVTGGAATGSAFFVSNSGLAITNLHVAGRCSAIRDVNGRGFTLLSTDRSNDLALVKADGSRATPFLRFSSERNVRLGQNVVVLGFPLGKILSDEMKVSSGIVSSTSGIGSDQSLFQFTAPVQPGSSGGPVLDESGAVVGVVVATLDARTVLAATGAVPDGVNFAIKKGIVVSLLDSAGVDLSYSGATRPLTTEGIVEQSRPAVFALECF